MKQPPSSIECLEDRIAPAALSFHVVGHLLKITGDSGTDSMTITVDQNDPTVFNVSDSVDGGSPSTFTSPTGITDISINLSTGADSLNFSNATGAITVKGSVTIAGGTDAKNIMATDLTVGKNFSITNGKAASGVEDVTLTNLSVGGNLSIKSGGGNSNTQILRSAASFGLIGGNIAITNGAGTDATLITDTNVAGNVTINDGKGDTNGHAGHTSIFNVRNTSTRSVIKGNVSLSYIDGDGTGVNIIGDYEIGGNVSISDGKGNFTTQIDGENTTLPVIIYGNLTIKSSDGPLTIDIGTSTGVQLMKNLTVTGNKSADALTFAKLSVLGATKLSLGDGANTVKLDDSTFAGLFNLTTGKDGDVFDVQTNSNDTSTTLFEHPVLAQLGAGSDNFAIATANKSVIFWSTFIVHHGAGPDFESEVSAFLNAPFGNVIQFIP